MSDWYLGQLARQDPDWPEPQPAPAPVPPGALADQTNYDPWERAAAAVRFGAKPLAGRQEGVATTLPQELLAAPVRAAAGFTRAAFDRAAEEHGGVSQLSTDYDPRRMGALLGAETALNTVGFGSPFSQVGAVGSAGGKLGALAEQAPPFYSAVERAVQGAKQNVAPGQQWAGYLRNQPGVKPEEVEALGLGKLFEQPGAVPKQTVLDQIAANRVNVGEVVKGGDRPTQWTVTTAGGPAAQNPTTAFSTREAAEMEWGRRHRESPDAFHSVSELPTAGSQTKFQQYTLPGGENYREMLLTMPSKVAPAEKGISIVKSHTAPNGTVHYEWSTPDGRTGKHIGSEGSTVDSVRHDILTKLDIGAVMRVGQDFRSSHYDEPNILAHVRTNDRVIDGKKTLFVEEVQSDWHQAGRTKGYGTEEQRKQAITDQLNNLGREYYELPATASARRGEITDQMNVLHDQMTAVRREGTVPDAPFKTTWPELAMKRIIREAAEKGYDKVAWTPGSVQAARYPEQLRQHVDEIFWSSPGTPRSNPEGLRYVHAKPRAGGMDLVFTVNKDGMITEASASQAKGQHVEDIFGKDMSRQIMEKGEGEIASKDFVIGAKGMEGFYDEILPATVNKLVKKHGGRVQQGNIAKPPEMDFDALRRDPSGRPAMKFENQPVHTIDITPSLREQAMKGFPLFTAGGVAATGVLGELARQDRYGTNSQ